MNTNDMNTIWNSYDAKLEDVLRTVRLTNRTLAFARVKPLLHRLSRGLAWEIVFDGIALVAIGLVAGSPGLSVAARVLCGALEAFGVAILIAAIVQRVMLARLDYELPVVPAAEQFDRFALLRARVTFWTLAAAPLMWVPLLVVAARALAGIDATIAFDRSWLLVNLAFGAPVFAFAVVAARRGWLSATNVEAFTRLERHLSGAGVAAAKAQLEALRADALEETPASFELERFDEVES